MWCDCYWQKAIASIQMQNSYFSYRTHYDYFKFRISLWKRSHKSIKSTYLWIIIQLNPYLENQSLKFSFALIASSLYLKNLKFLWFDNNQRNSVVFRVNSNCNVLISFFSSPIWEMESAYLTDFNLLEELYLI